MVRRARISQVRSSGMCRDRTDRPRSGHSGSCPRPEMGHRRSMPAALALIAGFGVALVALPLIGLIIRTPWSRAGDILGSGSARTALRLSLIVATASALVGLLVGFPLAWAL